MKNKIIAFCFFILGILLYFINKDTTQIPTVNNNQINISFYKNMDNFINYKFIGIFINNMIVGLLLSVFGYLTGGFLTLLILIWNGFLVAMVYNMAIYKLPISAILYASKHAPFEIYAFLIFSEFGLKGRFFIKNILKNNEINFTLIPGFKKLIFPIILLLIASILEIL